MNKKDKALKQVVDFFDKQLKYDPKHQQVYLDAKKALHGGARQNSGRPSKEPTETINFRIPISDKQKLKRLPISKLFREWYKSLI